MEVVHSVRVLPYGLKFICYSLTRMVGAKIRILPVHPMKTYCGSTDMATLTLNLETIRRIGVNLTLWSVYLAERACRPH